MTDQEFIDTIRAARARGIPRMNATLTEKVGGIRYVVLENILGGFNGNPNDIWVSTRSGRKTLGRAYLGSKNHPTNLEGWAEQIESIDLPD